MLREALAYPKRTSAGRSAVLAAGFLLLGGALFSALAVLVPIVVLVVLAILFAVRGYYVRVLGAVVDGSEEPPKFADWGRLIEDGVKASLVGAAYFAPAVVLFALAWVAGILPTVGYDREPLFRSAAAAAVLLGLFCLLGAWYALPAGVTRFARSGDVGAAFDLDAVRTTVMTEDYAVAWVVGTGIWTVGLLTILVFGAVLVGVFGWVYLQVATRNVQAKGVALAEEVALAEGVERGEGSRVE